MKNRSLRKVKYFVGDFETTVYKGQVRTDVWASAVTEMFSDTEDVLIHHSIDETFDYLVSLNTNLVCFYHNLKFDGGFWLDFLLNKKKMTLALEPKIKENDPVKWLPNKYMLNNTFKCTISAMGQWYSIIFKYRNKLYEFRDSYKLLPFSVKRIGKSFKTKHKKLDMEYTGFRYPGCEITEKEREYIANDTLVIREALEFMFTEGHNKLTIGACCLSEFVTMMGKEEYDTIFPNLYEIKIDNELYGSSTAGEYVRKSYRGGWCYLVKGKENKRFTNGTTADVNSLYPSMMSSESGNRYPVGRPKFIKGDCDLRFLEWNKYYYFIRIKTRFYIKPNKLPFIQIKNSLRFRGNESLETSDYYDKKEQKYYTHYWFGKTKDTLELRDTRVVLTLTMTDFKLLKEHYDLVDFEILDLCYFSSDIGLFDAYMEKYKQLKLNSVGAMRELAKLFLNNLYGKMASSTDSSFKIPFVREDSSIGLQDIAEDDKKPGYIAVGSAITSYARNFTIRAAQMNYHGVDKRGFIYADTDSIHCDLMPDEIRGITVHDKNFCCWKLESCWDVAWFTRQKTYIEHVVMEDEKPTEPYYNIKCAGMPERCKQLFEKSLENYTPSKEDNYNDEELKIINAHYKLEDFTIGLKLPGKLMPRRIPGGVLLVETTYEMR